MSWEQVATPNLSDNLVVDGMNDWLGMCLAVAEVAGGTPRLYGHAWEAWLSNSYKHADRNLPDGLWVPVFWDGYWSGYRYGHVAWARRSGASIEIVSSPYTHKPYFDRFSGELNATINRVSSIYGMSSFAGWAEELATKRFVQKKAQVLQPYQRKVGDTKVFYRKGPSTDHDPVNPGDPFLDAGAIVDFKGYVRGQHINGTDIWYVGKYTGGYANAAGFTDSSTTGLADLTVTSPVPTPEPGREGLNFIDVSNWQGQAIDWHAVKAAGYAGVIIRAGHVGISYGGVQPYNIDPNHDRWAKEARNAGLLVGHYWYCYEELDPVTEATAFLWSDIVDGEPLFTDAEEKDLSEAWVSKFEQAIWEKLKVKPIYYDYTANLQAKTWVTGNVWQAHYGVGEGKYTQVRDLNVIMHQYTSDGSVNGVSGRVDLNKFYGTVEEWRAFGNWGIDNPSVTEPDPDPLPDPEPDPEPEVPKKSWWRKLIDCIVSLFYRLTGHTLNK